MIKWRRCTQVQDIIIHFALVLVLVVAAFGIGCGTTGSAAPSSAAPTATSTPIGQLVANRSTIDFGSLTAGTSATQALTFANSGAADVSITQASVSGAGFSLVNFTVPVMVAAGQSTTVTVKFAPTSAGSAAGSIAVVNNGSTSPIRVALSGTATAGGGAGVAQLAASPASISFGTVLVSGSTSQSVTLSNPGTSSVSVNGASMSGAGFSVTGLTTPLSLAPGQTSVFSVTFAPSTAGAVTGRVTLVNTSATSPLAIVLSGTGAPPQSSHSVSLSWTASTSSVVGYNVYRGTQSGGPYALLNSALVSTTSYTDGSVSSGVTYYYVTSAVDVSNAESGFSNEATAVIP